ncbi:MAG: lytic transglycosylase domain-containing protein, partial [Nitrospinota bacterium]
SYYGAMAHTRVLKLNGEKKVKESSGGSGIKKQSFASNGLYERVKKALKPAKERYREHLIKGLELARLGLFEYAELEFAAGGPALKGSIEKNMLSGDLFEMANNFNKAYQIRDQVLNRMSEARVEKMPFVFWKPFFPLSYWNNIERFSKKEGVDPFLVLSIIKQESVYDPMALSAANASGLMQIMPKTGRRLYQQVFNKAGFHREFLFNPKINLQLGITYLSGLLSTYKSDLVLAIATYNAGPKPVKRWAARYAGLPQDEFVEKIPYPETRKYVKKVLKNYVNYKELYSYQ